MTAVAPPLTSFQQSTRWSSDGNGFGATMDSEDVNRMFNPGTRKTAQRQNSSSSIASSSSSASTISASSIPRPNGPLFPSAPSDPGSWAIRKKPARGLWPPGKAEPATGISTARPQIVNSVTSGPTASSAISALHAPLMPPQQLASGLGQASGVLRDQIQTVPTAILHLVPMNGTFERKTITVPYAPDVLRIGRQTNQKTIPTPTNGYFDSKVLSRQHAEVYADRQGRILIRDVKSSNGTFVNGMRLSQENKESEPRELREGDQLELGIDIVSEDQKTVVHHKVAAKVEHAGVYGQGSDTLTFGDLDPSSGNGLIGGPHPLKRSNSSGSMNGRGTPNSVMGQAAVNIGALNQPAHMRNWLNPITTENLVKKLNAEMKLAVQQSQEIARARQAIELMLNGKVVESPIKEAKAGSDRARPSPIKARMEVKPHFSEPPAPPPQAPLPEKPDVARALADPVIQPLLRRSDTARAPSANSSPTRTDHSGDILRLCEELKLAKGELSSQSERMQRLESELAQERSARESAEERAQRLEQGGRRDSPTNEGHPSADNSPTSTGEATAPSELQMQLDRLHASMEEMRKQMEVYSQRAATAEMERDIANKSLAEMIEEKRKENAQLSIAGTSLKSVTKARRTGTKASPLPVDKAVSESSSEMIDAATQPKSPTTENLMERAGIEKGKPITPEQAEMMTRFLAQEVLGSQQSMQSADGAMYYTLPYGSFAAVILLGYVAMTWMNGWPKIER